ncbi:MAG: nitroreductase family protein [Defluviitaleaceae bacterium]|nr:nitroreductase family protein [Defluviitaleaceae bacterium]MCL2275638.1 nitroreductase family protein [Defluviitaleaceae bacterium]
MLLEAIKNRRSIRAYKDTPVSKEQLKILLEAAMLSPSACNTRPWKFIAVTRRETLNALADVHKWAQMLRTAPAAIVMLALPETQAGIHDGLAEGYFPQDLGAATESILIQAESMGLSACWCGVFPKDPLIKAVREVLGLSENDLPFNIIAVGERGESPAARGAYDENKVAWIE